jgi:hypothetical protein
MGHYKTKLGVSALWRRTSTVSGDEACLHRVRVYDCEDHASVRPTGEPRRAVRMEGTDADDLAEQERYSGWVDEGLSVGTDGVE